MHFNIKKFYEKFKNYDDIRLSYDLVWVFRMEKFLSENY